MAKLKLTWKAGGSSMSVRGVIINGTLLMSSYQKDAAVIAKEQGKKNIAPFVITQTRALIGDSVEFESKPTNTIEIAEKRSKNGQYKTAKKSVAKFTVKDEKDTVKVTVKKRGFIFGLLKGKYKIKVS